MSGPGSAGSVVLIDGDTRWRRNLQDALVADGLRVTVAENEIALATAVTTATDVPDVVVLCHRGSPEAMRAVLDGAMKLRTNRARIALIADGLLTPAAIAQLYEVGACDVIKRSDGFERAAHVIRARLFADRRAAERWPVRARTKLVVADARYRARTNDISVRGAMVKITSRRPIAIRPNTDVELHFSGGLRARGVVRRAHSRKGFFFHALELGVQLADEPASATAAAALIERWRLVEEARKASMTSSRRR